MRTAVLVVASVLALRLIPAVRAEPLDTWHRVSPGRSGSGVAFGNGLFVTNGGLTSPDGVTWTETPGAGGGQGMTYGNGLFVAVGEGYEWGGGCWNDNNRDDTPGQPDSNGEGPDCSGFVFKTWELRSREQK